MKVGTRDPPGAARRAVVAVLRPKLVAFPIEIRPPLVYRLDAPPVAGRAMGCVPPTRVAQGAPTGRARAVFTLPANSGSVFLFGPSDRTQFQHCFARWDEQALTPVELAEDVAHGRLRYFQHAVAEVGLPPDWHANPFTSQRAPSDRHWTEIDDFSYGDIKVIWEPNRFSFAYALVRAYWRTGEERWPELFWALVEDWQAKNPPQLGPNWKCGQEIAFRLMAWCFGLYGFLASPETTAERMVMLAQMIALSGQRIEANIDYALSQRNNHGISEGVGLWTIGLLFPEFRHAAQWRSRGREVLEAEGQALIYDDGAFAQHSVNYHRLMLHDYVWALQLGDLHQTPFSASLRTRIAQAGKLLYQMQDEQSGRVPSYGQNDGAMILPLSNCDYQDFRPVVQATHYLTMGIRCYTEGPWDEDLLWLFGLESVTGPVMPQARGDLRADSGGYYILRSPHGFVFTRCAVFRHRPSQADMLHADLWWRGSNVTLDAGTYSYNALAPWANALAHTAYHNTVTIDDLDQMERIGQFLWLPWLHGRVQTWQQSPRGRLAYWQGEHNGYQRLKPPAYHQRGILRLGDDHWLVLDALRSTGEHRYRLHWLFPDVLYTWDEEIGHLTLCIPGGPYHVQIALLSGSGTSSLVRSDSCSARGWQAPYYNYRQPALSVDLAKRASSVCFWTLFSPEPCRVAVDGNTLSIATDCWQAQLQLQIDMREALMASVSMVGAFEDRLTLHE